MPYSVPLIHTTHVHFIHPYVLPDFIGNLKNLKNPFKFLSTMESYRKYYAKFEKGKSVRASTRPSFVPGIGELLPLPRSHAFDSFWKAFRIKARRRAESFFLMPLSVSLRKIAEEGLDSHAYAYLFPFGVSCVNQEITYSEAPFSFEELIRRNRLKRNRFNTWAISVARTINECLFDPSDRDVDPFHTHSLIFLDYAKPSLVFKDVHHARAIAGLIESKTDFRYLTRDQVYDRILSCKLPPLHDGEILIFRCSTTFLYPSKRDPQFKKKSTFGCMHHNYSSFLNFIFAVNRFLRTYKSRQNQMSKRHLGEIKRAFQAGFRCSNSDYLLEYFTNIYKPIAKRIGLDERLKEFMEAE